MCRLPERLCSIAGSDAIVTNEDGRDDDEDDEALIDDRFRFLADWWITSICVGDGVSRRRAKANVAARRARARPGYSTTAINKRLFDLIGGVVLIK